jgi:hypothetical protein
VGSTGASAAKSKRQGAGTGHSPRYPNCGTTQSDRLLGVELLRRRRGLAGARSRALEGSALIRGRFEALRPRLDERCRRLFCAAEARTAGYGGVTVPAADDRR